MAPPSSAQDNIATSFSSEETGSRCSSIVDNPSTTTRSIASSLSSPAPRDRKPYKSSPRSLQPNVVRGWQDLVTSQPKELRAVLETAEFLRAGILPSDPTIDTPSVIASHDPNYSWWLPLPLPWAQKVALDDLLGRVEDIHPRLFGWWDEKFRYDYFAEQGILVIRMAGYEHEHFLTKASRHVDEQLKEVANKDTVEDEVKRLVSEVEWLGHEKLKGYQGNVGKSEHVPDNAFGKWEYPWPRVIFEVAKTQAGRELADLADDYLVKLDAPFTDCMIGFDLPRNQKSKSAWVSVWRAHLDDSQETPVLSARREQHMEFRSADGTPCDGSLAIPIASFVDYWGSEPNNPALERALKETQVHLSFDVLSRILCEAERLRTKREASQLKVPKYPANHRKHFRD